MSKISSEKDAARPMAACPACKQPQIVRFVDGAWEIRDHTAWDYDRGTFACEGTEAKTTPEAIHAWANDEYHKVRKAICAVRAKATDDVINLRKQIDAIDERMRDVR